MHDCLYFHPYHKESHGAASVDSPVLYVGLVSQVVGRLDGNLHPLDGQEGCQVGRVGGDDDEGEEPPDTADDSTRQRPASGRELRKTQHESRLACAAHQRINTTTCVILYKNSVL